jgi:hypothetical protein
MLRTLVRSLSLVAILAGTAAAAGGPSDAPSGSGSVQREDSAKVTKNKSARKSKKAARKAKHQKHKAKKHAKTAH